MSRIDACLVNRLSLGDRVALITGAAHGIGRATALELSAAGAAVVVADIDEAAAAALTEQIRRSGGQAMAAELDVASEAAVEDVIAKILPSFDRIDVLVSTSALRPFPSPGGPLRVTRTRQGFGAQRRHWGEDLPFGMG